MLKDVLQALHDHKDELLVLVSVMALCVSFLTALIGPIVQLRIARFNATTNVLMANRVKWIEALQADIATYAALLERTEFLTKSMDALKKAFPKLDDKQSEEFDRMFREYEEKTFERNKLGISIGIKLDVSNEKRQKLFDSIGNFAKRTTAITTGIRVDLEITILA